MRLLLAALVPCCALSASNASGEKIFPYKAYITADDVYVRSGPGQTYYPTGKLPAGQEVEVYRHDPGGWYAIKPPKGSFTWISARFLKPGVDNLAVVTDDRVAARVGSRFSDIRDVIQVRLQKAEVVEVLEQKQTGSELNRTTWYKIAPPSGEFRWVFGKYVDPDYPHEGLRKTHAAENTTSLPSDLNRDAAGQQTTRPSGPTVAVTPTPAQPQQPQPADEPPADERPDEPLPVTARHEADLDWKSAEADEPISVPRAQRGISPEEYRARLEKIDVELSIMVVEEPTVWTFAEMRLRVEELLGQAETAVERGLARVMLDKIARFEDLKQRHNKINLVRKQTVRSNRRLAAPDRRDRDTGRRPDEADRFDGTGELTQVVSSKLGAPRYALVDRGGGVSCYVSPAPGVNLRHYVGRRVGVTGTRGYMPEQRAHHVMALHVSALDGQRLR